MNLFLPTTSINTTIVHGLLPQSITELETTQKDLLDKITGNAAMAVKEGAGEAQSLAEMSLTRAMITFKNVSYEVEIRKEYNQIFTDIR